MKKVYVASMSRSGGTLLYQMLKLLVELRDVGTGVGFPVQNAEVPDHHRFAIYKSEDCKPWMQREIKSGKAFAVGTYRDPRDVAASLWRFYDDRSHFKGDELDHMHLWGYVIENALPAAVAWYETWEQMKIYHTRYELVHPKEWHIFLVGVARHIGLDATMDEARTCYRQFSIAKNIARCAQMTSWISPHTLLTQSHISENRGRAGTWRAWLNEEQSSQVMDVCGSWMERHGYK